MWFQNRRQREKTGPELEIPRPSELRSSFERYPPREAQREYVQGRYGTPPYISPMLREASFRTNPEEMVTVADNNFGRQIDDSQSRGIEIDTQSEGHSAWGGSVASEVCRIAFGNADQRRKAGWNQEYLPSGADSMVASDTMSGCGSMMSGILSSSDDIVHALMEFEGLPGGLNSFDDLSGDVWTMRADPGSKMSCVSVSEACPVGRWHHEMELGMPNSVACDTGSYGTKAPLGGPESPGIENQDASGMLQSNANAEYSASSLQSILAACQQQDEWRGSCSVDLGHSEFQSEGMQRRAMQMEDWNSLGVPASYPHNNDMHPRTVPDCNLQIQSTNCAQVRTA